MCGIKSCSQICRLCLALTTTTFSLIEDSKAASMLEALTSLRILPSDEISTVMCLKCFLNLKLAFSIQQRMLKAEQRFQAGQFLIEIKQEYNAENTKLEQEENANNKVLDRHAENLKHGCDICGKKWPTRRILMKHKRAIHVIVDCKICGVKLKAGSLRRHLHLHSVEDKTLPGFPCDICDVKQLSQKVLTIHKEEVHGVKFCRTCKKNVEKGMLKEHKLIHDEETARELYLQNKQTEAVSQKEQAADGTSNTQVKHSNEQEQSVGKYVCDFCGKRKNTQAELTKHKSSVHVQGKCPICQKVMSQTNLKRHIERHNDPLTVCELCGVSFKQQDLRVHMYNNHMVRELKCSFCDKIFKKNYHRTVHQKKEHLGQADFTCETCGKRFFQKHQLKKHAESTHLKLRAHVCGFCKVGFSSKFALKTHLRRHTNEKPFKCEFCGEGFRQNVSLKTHLRSQHEVEEELKCECGDCGKKFASTAALLSHKRIHM